MNIRNTRH